MSEEKYMQFFRETDKDGSGYLTLEELVKMLRNKGYSGTDSQIRKMFDQFDSSGDGKISLQEYKEGMGLVPPSQHKSASMRSVFRSFDKNRDGTIDKSELDAVFREMGKVLQPDEVERIFRMCDKDGSGTLNYEEFIEKVFGKKA